MNKEEELLRKKSPVNIRNKKASFEYFLLIHIQLVSCLPEQK